MHKTNPPELATGVYILPRKKMGKTHTGEEEGASGATLRSDMLLVPAVLHKKAEGKKQRTRKEWAFPEAEEDTAVADTAWEEQEAGPWVAKHQH